MSAWKRLMQHRNMRAAFAYTSQQLNVLSKLFARQCEAVAAQRVRRAWQLCILYSRIYDKRFLKRLIDHFKQRLLLSRLSLGRQTLFSATMFSMLKGEISDEEMNAEIQTLIDDFNAVRSSLSFGIKTVSWLSSENANETKTSVRESTGSKKWELVVNEPSFRVWRSMNTQISAYEYRVFGSFNDVSARSFFSTQIDLAYRRTWDESVLLIDVLDSGKENSSQKVETLEPLASEPEGAAGQSAQIQSNVEAGETHIQSELIRWVTQYPFPLPTREYIYRRRQFYDKEKNFFFVLSRSVGDSDMDVDGKSASGHKVSSGKSSRSQHYKSALVVLPHSANVDEHGCDYFLSYVDDPQVGVPVRFANWCAATGLSKCHRLVHDASIKLEQQQLVSAAAQKLSEQSTQQQQQQQQQSEVLESAEKSTQQQSEVPQSVETMQQQTEVSQSEGKSEKRETSTLSDQPASESQSIPLVSSVEASAGDALTPHLKLEPESVKFIDGLIAKWLAFQRSETTRENLRSVSESTGPGRETESEVRRSLLATLFLSRR